MHNIAFRINGDKRSLLAKKRFPRVNMLRKKSPTVVNKNIHTSSHKAKMHKSARLKKRRPTCFSSSSLPRASHNFEILKWFPRYTGRREEGSQVLFKIKYCRKFKKYQIVKKQIKNRKTSEYQRRYKCCSCCCCRRCNFVCKII